MADLSAQGSLSEARPMHTYKRDGKDPAPVSAGTAQIRPVDSDRGPVGHLVSYSPGQFR
jgi:hypothetical protein